jgi:hypothetical protein
MGDTPGLSSALLQQALLRTRALIAEHTPEQVDDFTVIERAITQRDELKAAGDAMAYAIAHPTRDLTRLLQATVDYRRISDEIEGLSSSSSPGSQTPG